MSKMKLELFDTINYTLLTLICVVMLYPFINVASVSLSSYSAYVNNPTMIWPHEFSLAA
ncbi:MAG: binding-protein-dependent transport system inner rane component, partial [Paenibacillus sp.]|nr:binding-protein-dependent transport system inner rane component [Paenibacillus sp.]